MPIDYANYPDNWFTEIRKRILERAGGKCEKCGIGNGVLGHRDRAGQFWIYPDEPPPGGWTANTHLFRIVLTIAHLDHDTGHNEDDNLAAFCQRCHLRYDAEYHAGNAARTRRRRQVERGQGEIIFE